MRVLENPTFSIETGQLLFHDGETFVEDFPIRFDRGATGQAKTQGQNAGAVAGQSQSNANQIYSSLVPGLIRQAQTPQGFTAQQMNTATTAAGEAAGGANAALTGEGRLAALRSRTAGGTSAALDEAARAKNRSLATSAQDLQLANARLGLQRQAQAQQQLQGLYGTNTNDMLRAMGLQNQDLQTQLEAGRQGWLQSTEGVLGTIGGLGQNAARAYGSLYGGGGGGNG
jgi:hypothetical protein